MSIRIDLHRAHAGTNIHLERRFRAPNPAPVTPAPQNPGNSPMLALQDAPAERAQS
jgi:hypothetical protein